MELGGKECKHMVALLALRLALLPHEGKTRALPQFCLIFTLHYLSLVLIFTALG